MTDNFVFDSYKYFELLYNINQKLVKLIGIDIIMRYEEHKTLAFDIMTDLLRLIPCKKNLKKNVYEISTTDGLMDYRNEIPHLYEDYNNILKQNYYEIEKIIKIRNKLEHKIHLVKVRSSSNGTNSPYRIEVMIENDSIIVDTNELILIVSMLNNLYSKIASEINTYSNNSEMAKEFYNNNLMDFDYKDFNELYNSSLIKKISRLQQSF